ncbi:MAG: prepilin-type N-terminal cleavage/methylation domain-containing protein [Phycisphaerales bacterium]|nr:MAG: prepilin-type N-terminal cleavage/methylation domain-containing protein [Phycisphaerales bacterium]
MTSIVETNGAATAGRNTKRRAEQRGAFTLIELLVVVSIIALLISILLPSLQAAREQAKTVVCTANTAGHGRACASYVTENNSWIPGSPGTTGSELLGKLGALNEAAEEYPTGSGTWKPAAVQIWDWAGPLAALEMRMALTGLRPRKLRAIAEEHFVCPSNQIIASPYLNGATGPTGGFDFQKMISYNTIRNLLMWPRSGDGPPGPFPYYTSFDQIGGTTKLPGHQAPQIGRIGNPSEKIFLADGSRYTTTDGVVDFDVSWDGRAGGSFSNPGPTLRHPYRTSYFPDDPERRYSYRHGKRTNPGLVAIFFDGHAEYLPEPRSRFPDYWWPKGTEIPAGELNAASQAAVTGLVDSDNIYRVRR